MKMTNDEAVTVARGIAVKRVKIAPSEPAVTSNTVLLGVSVSVAAAVQTAVAVFGVCANGAVYVRAIMFP
jgi:hypothetical protein